MWQRETTQELGGLRYAAVYGIINALARNLPSGHRSWTAAFRSNDDVQRAFRSLSPFDAVLSESVYFEIRLSVISPRILSWCRCGGCSACDYDIILFTKGNFRGAIKLNTSDSSLDHAATRPAGVL